MDASQAPDSVNEQELTEKIRAGSKELGDYRDLAFVLASAGRYDDIIPLYEQALRLPLTDFQRAKVSLELGWILRDLLGQQAQPQVLAETAISLLSNEPDDPEVLFLRGSSHGLLAYCVWRTDENSGVEAARLAVEYMERVIAERPNLGGIGEVYCDSARLQNLLGNATKAIVLCEEALQHELDEADRLSCLIYLAEALRCAHRLDEAERAIGEAFRHVEADKGMLPRLYYEKGLIERSTNRSAGACSTFFQAVAALETHPRLRRDPLLVREIHWNLGELYYESRQYKEAAEALQQVVLHYSENEPYRSNALLMLGHCHLGTGSYVKARNCYEEVLSVPDAPEADRVAAREGLAALPPPARQRFRG